MSAFVAGTRTEFVGTLKQHGTRLKANAIAERWLLLVDVAKSDTGQGIAKRLWLRDGEWSRNMNPGHRYAFYARMQRCNNIRQAPGISGRINQGWRIANPNNVREVAVPQKTKHVGGKETRTFKVQVRRSNKTARKSGRVNREPQIAKPNEVREGRPLQKAKSLDEGEIRTTETQTKLN